jgi:hypothetical protein
MCLLAQRRAVCAQLPRADVLRQHLAQQRSHLGCVVRHAIQLLQEGSLGLSNLIAECRKLGLPGCHSDCRDLQRRLSREHWRLLLLATALVRGACRCCSPALRGSPSSSGSAPACCAAGC